MLVLLLLFIAGLSAGFVDAVAGGGGLITVPALLWAGLPVQWTLGTNKMQSSCGTALAVSRYAKAGLVTWKEVRLAVLFTFIASILGAIAVGSLSKEVLKVIVPWLMLAVAVYSLLSPKMGDEQRAARLSAVAFAVLGGTVLGFYDGFFGPGTGSFWTISLITLRGLELTRATAFTKVVNLASNLGSLLVFWHAGTVDIHYGLVMIAGQLIGARLGAGMVLKHGAVFVRRVFLAVVFAITAKLLWNQWMG
ncbi:MAG: rane protein [Verrucomicrobiaceae bacterium]|nr:rane protein [Verrucomicrobiaceae bacterium]